jgi:uncharacterized protein (TIGR02466 family)
MITHLFSHPLWKSKLEIDIETKQYLLQQIEHNYQTFRDYVHPNWNCNVHSSCLENNEIDYTSLLKYITQQYSEFSTQRKLKLHSYKIDGPWYNYYVNGSNQEPHSHAEQDVIYSGVYFLKLNQDHPRITFYNTSGSSLYYEGQRQLLGLYDRLNIEHTNTCPFYNLDVFEDDLIFFPAYLSHGVYVQKTDEPRITISFNFSLDKQH